MDTACTQPAQEEMGATNNRHIPPEIVQEILLNLPPKSLLRFYCVSNSWNSMIFESGFFRRYHGRAAFSGRERIVINPYTNYYLRAASTCPLSSISNQPIEDATDLICPFGSYGLHLHAFCDELWCVEVKNTLFLWNPSMRRYRKLPDPPLPTWPGPVLFEFVYGLGYDSVGDDYKILKIYWSNPSIPHSPETVLYSLRSDSWRKIQPFPGNLIRHRKGEFVSGALHWMADRVIISFDLSTEMYGEVAQPEYSPTPSCPDDDVEVIVLRGMLCVCLNYYRDSVFVLWVMNDYGVEISWIKMFVIQDCNSIPFFTPTPMRTGPRITLRPLYIYDNGEILIKASTDPCFSSGIFIYKDEKTIPQKIVGRDKCSRIFDGFVYVESLISPTLWPRTVAQVVGNNEA